MTVVVEPAAVAVVGDDDGDECEILDGEDGTDDDLILDGEDGADDEADDDDGLTLL